MRDQFRSIKSAVAVAALVMAFALPLVFAQSGHFVAGGNNAPVCEDIGTQVECSGKVAGLGGTTFEITVEASGVAITQCRNHGGNVAPGQDKEVMVQGTSDVLETPRNGRYEFVVSTNPPALDNSICPNDLWTPELLDVVFSGPATVSLFEDGVLSDSIEVEIQ